MKITKLLGNEETATEVKLEGINTFVSTVRAAYGNAEDTIDPIKVHTVDGYVPLTLLSDEEKVAVAYQQIKNAIAQATIVTEDVQGAKFDRLIEGLVAVDAILCNLDAKTDSAY